MNILVTRPREDAATLVSALRDLGHEPVLAPLLSISLTTDPALTIDGVQAVLITSANGARALAHQNIPGLLALPAFAVGDASARAARDAGFGSVQSANGDVDDLAALVMAKLTAGDGDLLHAAGSMVAGDLGGALGDAGFGYRRAALYQAHTATQLPHGVFEALKSGAIDGATFFSPRTGQTFANLIAATGLVSQLRRMTAFCLSPAVADSLAGLDFGTVCVASEPTQDALLQIVARLDKKN